MPLVIVPVLMHCIYQFRNFVFVHQVVVYLMNNEYPSVHEFNVLKVKIFGSENVNTSSIIEQ